MRKLRFKIGDKVKIGEYPKDRFASPYPTCNGAIKSVHNGKYDGDDPYNTGVHDYLIYFDDGGQFFADEASVIPAYNGLQKLRNINDEV